jgi:hypothetical protein
MTAFAGSDGQILDTATIPTKPADGADRAIHRILDAAAGRARRRQGADQVTAGARVPQLRSAIVHESMR